jgi:hypothetical protein
MRTADDILKLRSNANYAARELPPLSQGDVLAMDDLDDAFSEWDENAPIAQIAQGSQPHALPTTSRTVTLADPATTSRLARLTRPASVPQTLEEALLALALVDGIPELLAS